MRTILSAVAALACIFPAVAAPDFAFRGQWDIASPARPDYVGVVLIDAERRVTWDSPDDASRRPATFLGYVRVATKSRLEIAMTNRAEVSNIDCIIESGDLLHCHTALANGKMSPMFTLTRVGPGPVSLAPSR